MVYVAHGQLFFSSTARRQAVLDDITARIVGKPRFSATGIETLAAIDSVKYPGPGIALLLAFTSQVDAADLQARIESFATGARAPLTGSWLRLTQNRNDEDSTTADVETYRKVWP